jgi:hypothetical protein
MASVEAMDGSDPLAPNGKDMQEGMVSMQMLM